MTTDVNNISRDLIILGLKQIPEVGGILSGLCSALWPETKEDVWSEIKGQVEALVNQKISELVYQQVQEDLTGLNNNTNEYLWSLQNSQVPTYISEKWNFLNGEFLQQLPHFQSSGNEMLLLPLFTQFANLHISLLRDGSMYGKNWGWSDVEVNHTKNLLTTTIKSYKDYANKIYSDYYKNLSDNAVGNNHKTEPFKTLNTFSRQMTLTVLDYVNIWDYLDISKYPETVNVYLDREIYSDPYGTADNSNFGLVGNPRSFPTQINVWGWDRIDAVEVIYKENEGPVGNTSTGRMGDKTGGSNQAPHGGQFNLENNPVTKVEVSSGTIINSLKLHFADGSVSNLLGGNYTKDPGVNHLVEFSGHYLSSIKVMGISNYYGSADCIVLGFKLKK